MNKINLIGLRRAAIFTLLPLMACVTEDYDDGENAGLQPGDALPSFTVTMNDGSRMETADLSGRPSLILFFTTSCADCRRELPVIQRIYDNYSHAIGFMAISRGESDPAISRYWRENSLTMPYSAQSDRQVYSLFAPSIVPRIYIADSDRIIRHVYTDYPVTEYSTLSSALEALIEY